MKNRQFGILYQLLNRGNLKAKDLADRYEVSIRTIYRDIDMLSMAGIPIYAKKGRDGGICLMDHFVLNKMLLSDQDKQQILAALESLQAVGIESFADVHERLSDFFKIRNDSWVTVDFSDWSGQSEALYSMLKQAILNHQVIEFDYYGGNGTLSHRTVEPTQLQFKSKTWYLHAWCRQKQAMRLFKVLRMKRTVLTEEYFQERPACALQVETASEQNLQTDTASAVSDLFFVVLKIDASECYRIYDFFEEEEIQTQADGSFIIHTYGALDSWTTSQVLSFCPYVDVMEPPLLRDHIAKILSASMHKLKGECGI